VSAHRAEGPESLSRVRRAACAMATGSVPSAIRWRMRGWTVDDRELPPMLPFSWDPGDPRFEEESGLDEYGYPVHRDREDDPEWYV
jgi:hypothetical protein